MGANTSQILADSLPDTEAHITYMRDFANNCISKGQYQKAVDFYEAALIKSATIFGKAHKNTAIILNYTATAYQKQARYRAALSCCRKALDIVISLKEKDYHLTQQIWKSMGSIAVCQGDYPEALICYNNMLAIIKTAEGSKSVKAAEAMEEISYVHMKQGDFAEALKVLHKALKKKRSLLGENDNSVAETYNRIGKVHQEHGEFSIAFTYYRRAMDVKKEILGNEHSEVAVTHMNIASVCKDCGEHDDALEHYDKAVEIYAKTGENRPEAMCMLYCSIGLVYAERDSNIKGAVKWFEKANKLCTSREGERGLIQADVFEKMGEGFSESDKKEAMKHLKKAVEIREKILGKEHPLVASLYEQMGTLYAKMTQAKRALEMQKKALGIRLIALEEWNPSVGKSYWEVGSLLLDMGKSKEGRDYIANCVKVYEKCYGREHEMCQKAVEKLHMVDKKEENNMDDSGVYSYTTTQDSIEV